MLEGAFQRWLVTAQIEPTFKEHPFVQRACVLVVPQFWFGGRPPETAYVMIAYADRDQIDLDATVDAIVLGVPDSNLPPGITSLDLHRRIEPGSTGNLPVVICGQPYFAGWTRETEHGIYEGLDAFAVIAKYARGSSGEVVCRHLDVNVTERMDRVM